MNLVIELVKLAKEQRPQFIERWIKKEISDYDMDMVLIEEKKHRSSTYKKINGERNV